MIDRINELAKQCWVRVPYYPAGNDGHPEYNTVFSQEKFAKLIVQECADVCESFGESGDGYTCSAEILEHFGVQE